MTEWFSRGELIKAISANDRGLQYGDGLFETIAIRDGELRLWGYHLARLRKGCETLGLWMPSDDVLLEGVMHALRNSESTAIAAVAKIIITAGEGSRGYGRTGNASPSTLFAVFPAAPYQAAAYRDGIDLALCHTRLAVGSVTAGLKTLNRLEQVLARTEFAETELIEGLTMDADDNIICGTMSNVFFIKDRMVHTPSLDRCGVEGVMRRHVITCLEKQGIATNIRRIKIAEMSDFDEVFISNSQFGVLPVRRCTDVRWGVADRTREIMSVMADNGVAECLS
ncbi:MAG: aminodeoxychorismate lyase [Woeseiaceae bacterium]|nr:aminodeoxychorismate lyase [Woeseiaceae bacterium]